MTRVFLWTLWDRQNIQKQRQSGFYRWSIILPDTDFFQESESVSAANFRGRLNRPSTFYLFLRDLKSFCGTLISLINVEVGINVEGVQKKQNH